MQKIASLKKQAIKAAKNLDWDTAVEVNQQILAQLENDIGALNRLGVAYLQLKKPSQAKKAFKQVLKQDKSNQLAKKNLAKIKNNQTDNICNFTQGHFIQEPGKTRIVKLKRLAGKPVLKKLTIGQKCQLVCKNRYISVETKKNNTYIGSLPEDISCRLAKLIKSGNEYSCCVHSCTEKTCRVHIQETKRSPKNAQIHSFPPNRSTLTQSKHINTSNFVLEKDIPVQVVNTDEDETDTTKIKEKINEIASG
ncbi:MAG: hypothetical protein GF390_04000 [Candidatus Pacebacteria bacterium]|nr:hypothetical protein [Candidatus Paceibacterota bacterium]